MDSSHSKSKNSKSKNWNIFRSPQQKDLFDFLDHEQRQQLKTYSKEYIQSNRKQKSYKEQSEFWENNNMITEQKAGEEEGRGEDGWRSDLTFATRYQEGEEEGRVGSERGCDNGKEMYFRAGRSSKSRRNVLNQQSEEDNILLTSRQQSHKPTDDSFSNVFFRQITTLPLKHAIPSSTQHQKKKLFENINLHTSHPTSERFEMGNNCLDHTLILKTLNEIKEINKENLFVNKKILSSMVSGKGRGDRGGKGKSVGGNLHHVVAKSSQKKRSLQQKPHHYPHQTIPHQTSTKGLCHSRNEFYLYQKPIKTFSSSKLSQNRSSTLTTTHHKRILTTINNINTTKLSLGDRTLLMNNKLYYNQNHNQSKSTIKKEKTIRKKDASSNLKLDDHIEKRLGEGERVRKGVVGGKVAVGKGGGEKTKLLGVAKTGLMTTNKKMSKSHLMVVLRG